jgi:hypothetical protein
MIQSRRAEQGVLQNTLICVRLSCLYASVGQSVQRAAAQPDIPIEIVCEAI